MENAALTETIIGSGMKVHRTLGSGYLESVYKNALAYELRSRGLSVEREVRMRVRYERVTVGAFVVDMLVDATVIVEIKAIRALAPSHEAQVVNYLTALGIETGLLLNFGSDRLEFKRKARTYRPRGESRRGADPESRQVDRQSARLDPVILSTTPEGPTASP